MQEAHFEDLWCKNKESHETNDLENNQLITAVAAGQFIGGKCNRGQLVKSWVVSQPHSPASSGSASDCCLLPWVLASLVARPPAHQVAVRWSPAFETHQLLQQSVSPGPWRFLLKCYQQLLWGRVALWLCIDFSVGLLWMKKHSDEAAWKKMHHPLLRSLPLEIRIYFETSSQKVCCHSYLSSHGLQLNDGPIFSGLWKPNWECREKP